MKNTISAFIAVVVATVVIVAVISYGSSSPEFTDCHENLTCDGTAQTCHRIDGSNLCVRKIERVDTRFLECFSIAEEQSCYPTRAACLSMRGKMSQWFSPTECTTKKWSASGPPK